VKRKVLYLLIVLIMMSSPVCSQKYCCDPELRREALSWAIRELQPRLDVGAANKIALRTIETGEKLGLNATLLVAMAFVESSLNPMAVSKKNAIGLMQIRYDVWKNEPELINNGVKTRYDLFQIVPNIKCGAAIFLKYYLASNKSVIKALHRYHTGQSNLPKGVNEYSVTYANNVLITEFDVRMMMREYASRMELRESSANNLVERNVNLVKGQ